MTEGDPREALPPDRAGRDVMPSVARAGAGIPGAVIVVLTVAFGVMVFMLLDARRRAAQVPAVRARADEQVLSNARLVPPLYVPPPAPAPVQEPTFVPPAPAFVPPSPAPLYMPQPQPQVRLSEPAAVQPLPAAPPRPTSAEAAMVYDATAGSLQTAAPAAAAGARQGATTANEANRADTGIARTKSGQFANKAATVMQGTLIPAVLETGFDSTHGGMARALVTQDVRGFDGSRVLVPRGTRLIGDYQSDVVQGQRRALIEWVRLIRPDGATMVLDSQATDTVGRSGIKAKVSSHFLERFEGAILQSALQVGVNLASSNRNPAVVLALPGATQTVGNAASTGLAQNIPPTLKVAPGTSISVMVARDLEFPGMEDGR